MAEDTSSGNPAVIELGDQVNQLLEQVDTECARLENQSPTPPLAPSDPASESTHPAPHEPHEPPHAATTPVNEQINDQEIAPEKNPEAEPVSERKPISEGELDTDLDEKIGEMIAQAEQADPDIAPPQDDAAPHDDTPPPIAAGENKPDEGSTTADEALASLSDVTEVDDCLADLTSQLLEGDFESADGEITPGSSIGAPPDLHTTLDHSSAGRSGEAGHTGHAKPGVKMDDEAVTISIPLTAWINDARKGVVRAWCWALPLGAAGVLKVNAPLESREATVRQTVGWMAMYTAFLAACVWVYVLMVRSPEAPAAGTVPAMMVDQGASDQAALDQGSGEADSSSFARQD